jgi:S-adenosylmethionine:tRNA ribosyltransferase-isomerase
MISSTNISLKEFDYTLPENRIAQFPLEKRDSSKLLIWKDGSVSHDIFSKIGDYLPEKCILVFNDTKVIRARLLFSKNTGATIEIFCLEPLSPAKELQTALSQRGSATWECLVGNAKRWRSGRIEKRIDHHGTTYILAAMKKENLGDGCFSVEFTWEPEKATFAEILEMAGKVPLPPYISRASDENDTSHYQTIYAKYEGSVAAPTAGLHFTKQLLEKLRKKSVLFSNVTLHVGLGTFRPVSSPDILKHQMHEEKIWVHQDTLEMILTNPEKPIIAVGTTSVRTLESLYWIGVKLIVDQSTGLPIVSQWDPYDPKYNIGIPLMEALTRILYFFQEKKTKYYSGVTRIMIIPGYEFKVTDGMITNFHLPKSTLLMLIAAFTGNSWKSSYEYALQNDFRFLSYGDACLLIKTKFC